MTRLIFTLLAAALLREGVAAPAPAAVTGLDLPTPPIPSGIPTLPTVPSGKPTGSKPTGKPSHTGKPTGKGKGTGKPTGKGPKPTGAAIEERQLLPTSISIPGLPTGGFPFPTGKPTGSFPVPTGKGKGGGKPTGSFPIPTVKPTGGFLPPRN